LYKIKYLRFLIIIHAIILSTSPASYAQMDDYTGRIKAKINASQVVGNSDLTNFPVLVSLSNTNLKTIGNGGLVNNANGYDISFTSDNAVTVLSHQLESYDGSTGNIEFWVRFPSLSATSDTEFYIYFGNSSINSDQSSTNVWDSNYKLVLHLDETASGPTNFADASGETPYTDISDNATIATTGQIGGARQFSGTNTTGDRITVRDNGLSSLDISGNITISLWVDYPSNLADSPDLITKGDYLDGYGIWSKPNRSVVFQINNDGLETSGGPGAVIPVDVWTYLTVTRATSGRRVIYINGAEAAIDTSIASFSITDDDLFLSSSNPLSDFTGSMDEVRISNITRDSAWIATEYNNQSSPSGFITQINTEPVLKAIESSALTYNSMDPPSIITSNLVISDGNETNIESATVAITSNFDGTEDVLGFVNQNGITGSYSSSSGILTLTGTATIANYQTALRSVTYQNIDPNPVENTRSVSFTVNDGNDDSNTETRDISVVKVNIAPLLSNLETSSVPYFAGNGKKEITFTLDVSDIDDSTLTSAVVQITSNYLSSEDTLYFNNQAGITGTWTENTGKLRLTGSATLAAYQAALRSVTYENESGAPSTSIRTISISVNDGIESGNTATRNIEYPTSITELATYKSPTVFHFDAQDADGDGNPATNQPADGNLSDWADRSFYVSASSFEFNATAGHSNNEPKLSSPAFGGRTAVVFDGVDDGYQLQSHELLNNNSSGYPEKSFAVVFRTGDTTNGLQTIYAQGGATRGYQLSIKDGTLYAYIWNTATNQWPDNNHKAINLGSVQPNISYIVIASHDATAPDLADQVWEANVNGGTITTLTSVRKQFQHRTGRGGIANNNRTIREPVAPNGTVGSATTEFNGSIAELISWNSSLSTTDFTNIYGFLSSKWLNTPPVLAGIEISPLSYMEGDATTAITSTLTLTDVDTEDNTTEIDSAKVYISNGFVSSEDVLAYTTALGITGSYNTATGVLSLTGSTTSANYQAALRNVTYQNTETTSPTLSKREISFIVYDWDDPSAVITREIDVIPFNDLPVLTNLETNSLTYTEGSAAIDITSTLTISDNDNTTLQGATVAFTNNYLLGEDELSYTNVLGITGSFDSSTGVLILSGTATLANYQAAVRNVTFENTSSDPVTGITRTIEIRVFDGINYSSTGTTRDILVLSSSTAPALANIEREGIFYEINQSSIITENITISDPDDTQIDTVKFQISTNYDSTEDTLQFQSVFGITSLWTDATGTLTLTGPASKSEFQSAIRTVTYSNTAPIPTDIDRTVSITASDGERNSNTLTRSISFSIPKSVSDLLVWLKGDAGTFTTTNGNTTSSNSTIVGRWEDQSGNDHHFTATNSGSEPTFKTNVSTINFQNAIEFPGASGYRLEDIDAENYLNGLSALTIFFVLESDDVNTDQGFWTTYEPDATGEDKIFSIRYDSQGDNGLADDVITTGMRDLTTAFVMESFEAAQSTVGQIVMLKWTSEQNYELYVDGVLSNPTHLQNVPTGILTDVTTAIIGQGTKDQSSSWDGLIAEVILYGKELAITEQQDVEDYLSTKYDIAIRSLTAATGGEAISADSANVTNGYVTLTGPRVQESFVGEFTSAGTFVFNAPSGFEWDITNSPAPSASVSSAFGGSTELAVSFTSRTASQITFTIGTESSSNPGEITFSDFRVRPTTGILPNSGTITNTGTTGLGGSTDYGKLTMIEGAKTALKFSRQPTISNLGSAISPTIRVQLVDQFGNPVEESQVTVSIAGNIVSGNGTLGGTTTSATNVFGVAEFNNLTLSAIGEYTLTASSTGLSSTTSTPFDVVAIGQLTQFIVERFPSGNISNKLAGQSFNISITAADSQSDTVRTFTGTVGLSSNCTLGAGQGTTSGFIAGVLSPVTVSVSSLGTCSITAINTSGSAVGASNTFVVTPGAPSEAATTITANPTVILNNGFSTSTITVQTKDSEGNNLTAGGETVSLNTTDGILSSVTDNSDGTYTATLTSSVVAGTATITGTLNAAAITDDAKVEFAAFNNLWQSSVGSVANAQDWDLATNWSLGSVPVSGDKVLIPSTPTVGNEHPVINTTNTKIARLLIEGSASVTISGAKELIVSGDLSGNGEILGSNSDSLTVGGDLAISEITTGYVKLDGSVNQNVITPNNYVNLELDNTNGADFTTNLIVSGTLKLTNGTLFMPTGTNLIANTKEYGTGNIRMQQRMYGMKGYRMISSPIDTTYGEFLDGILTQGYPGSTLGNAAEDSLQPTVLIHLENYPGTYLQRLRAPTSSTQKVTQGQGMFVFLFGDIAADSRYNDPLPDTLDVTGREFDGDGTEVDFGITYTPAADSGWNLVGNPFLATIDWDDNANWTKTNVESTIYIWDPSANGGQGEYLTWNGVTGTLPNGGLIPPFQGFWVKANAASPELAVNKAAKTTGGSFLRKEFHSKTLGDSLAKVNEPAYPVIDLGVTSSLGRSKRTSIMFSEEGSLSKDPLDGFRLLPLSDSFIELHTLLNNGTEIAINNLPIDFNSRLFIPVHVAAYENGAPVSGELTFVWGDLRAIPEDWILTLIDHDTGAEINMKEELSYTFTHSTRAKVRINSDPLNPAYAIRAKAQSMDTRFTLKISTEQIERDVPEEIFLSQNYPNPFNPSTTINFGVDQSATVVLEVYDILGRKVQTLINGQQDPGRYQARFDGRSLASGVYFYRLQANNEVFIKKMTLIK